LEELGKDGLSHRGNTLYDYLSGNKSAIEGNSVVSLRDWSPMSSIAARTLCIGLNGCPGKEACDVNLVVADWSGR
jgi:hypothetical protein